MADSIEKKLRVGILGTGSMAGVMAKAIRRMKHVEAVAVASRSLESARAFAIKYDLPRAWGSYDALMEDEDVDLIYIATPHSHHALYASRCIDHKKPVLVEKSFTANAGQAEQLIAKAEREDVFLAEAIWTRYMPLAKRLKEVALSGRIGKINSVSCNLGYAVSDNYRVVAPELAGGALLDVGVYALTFISLILGDKVKNIYADARLSEGGVDLENHVVMVYEEEKGEEVRASFYSSVIGPTDRLGVIYGADGYIEVGNINNFEYLVIYDNDHKLVERIDCPLQEETGYVYQFEACRKALSEGKTEPEDMPHAESVIIMKLMDQIRQEMGVKYPFE